MLLSPVSTRNDLVARICERARSQNGMFVSITGHAGMGKTWLLRALAGAMTSTTEVHFVTADEFETHESFSFIDRLLSTGITTIRTVTTGLQPVAVARETLAHLRRSARPQLQAVIIDDAQWIDADSAQVLRYLVPRIMRQGYLIAIATRTPDLQSSHLSYLDTVADVVPHSLKHELAPLDVDDIRALGRDYFGSLISPSTARSLRNATGGSFLGIDMIFRRLTVEEKNSLHLLWDLPIRGVAPDQNPLLAGFRDLGPSARTAVEIVSTADSELSPSTVIEVAQRFGEDCDLDSAITAEVLSESGFGATVIPRHSLVAHAVRQTLPQDRFRAICRALAPTTSGYRSIMYSLHGTEDWSPRLSSTVSDYITAAVEQGNYENITQVLRRCLSITSGAERARMLCRLGLLNLRNKTMFRILDLLPQFEALPDSALKECLVITLLAHRTDRPFPQDRLESFLHRQDGDATTRTLQAFAAFLSVITVLRTRDYDRLATIIGAAQALIAEAPTDPAEVADPDLRWMVAPVEYRTLLDSYAIVQWGRRYAVAKVTDMLESFSRRVSALPASAYKIDALVPLAGAAVGIGELHRAHRLAVEGVKLLDTVDKPWAGGSIRLIHAHVSSLLGSLTEAQELVALAAGFMPEAIDVETRLALQGLETWLAAARGEENTSSDNAALAERLENMSWESYGADMMVIADCESARARGDSRAILSASRPERVTRMMSSQRGYLTYRAHALIDLGRVQEADALIAELERLRGGPWQEYWGTLEWLQARQRLSHLDPGTASQEELAAVRTLFEAACARSDYPLAQGLSLRDFGRFLTRSDDIRAAHEVLARALQVLDAIGAHAYTPGVREMLDTLTGAKGDLLQVLTSREREVARLVARGRSNREIADELFVAQTTVRYHVSNLLRKLHLSRRSEVATLVDVEPTHGRL